MKTIIVILLLATAPAFAKGSSGGHGGRGKSASHGRTKPGLLMRWYHRK
jgi:hypothetical protein